MAPTPGLRTAYAVAASSVLLVAWTCASRPQPAQPRTGCYYFQRDEAARQLRLPWGIRLLDEKLEGWPALQQRKGVRRAATLTPTGDEDHPFGYWAPLPGDSVEVGYPAGGGLVLELAIAPDGDLSGTATPVGDAGVDQAGARPTRPVRLGYALCPETQ